MSELQMDFGNRILQRHSSMNSFSDSFCCGYTNHLQSQIQIVHPVIPSKQKISITNSLLKKKTTKYHSNTASILHSRKSIEAKSYPALSQSFHQQRIIERSQKINKINFVYPSTELKRQSGQTNNYFLKKCIINPDKINIFVNQHEQSIHTQTCDQSKLKKSKLPHSKLELNSAHSDSFNANLIEQEIKGKFIGQSNFSIPNQYSNFSFGKHQKNELLAKLLASSQIEINGEQKKEGDRVEGVLNQDEMNDERGTVRPEVDEEKGELEESVRMNKHSDKEMKVMKKDSFRRGSLFNRVNLIRSETLNEDADSDHESEVVQDHDYKSMMGKIRQNKLQESNSSQEF